MGVITLGQPARETRSSAFFYALVLLLISLLFENSFYILVSGIGLSIADPFFLLLVLISAFHIAFSEKGLGLDKLKIYYIFLITVFCFISVAHILHGGNIKHNLRLTAALMEGLALVVILVILIREMATIEKLGKVILFISLLASCVAIFQGLGLIDWPLINKTPPSRDFFSFSLPWTRNAGLYSNYSSFNSLLLVGVAYTLVSLRYASRARKLLLFMCLGILIIGLAMPQSRAGLVSFTLMFICYIFWLISSKKMIFFLGSILALIAVFNFTAIKDEFVFAGVTSLEVRVDQYYIAFDVLLDNYFLGAGLGYFFATFDNSVHNIFLNVLLAFGAVGLLVFLLIVFSPYIVILFRRGLNGPLEIKCNSLTWVPLGLFGQIFVLSFASGLSLLIFWFMVACMMAMTSVRIDVKPTELYYQ